jgi:hypothetical protein
LACSYDAGLISDFAECAVNNILNISDFERTHFDAGSVQIRPHGFDIRRQMAGLTLTEAQIIGLAGAPKNSIITLGFRERTATEGERVPAGLYFKTTNDSYIRSWNEIGVFRDGSSGYGVYLKLIDFKAGGPKGLAGRMVAVIVRHALQLGNIKRLRLLAAGGRCWPPLNGETGERWGGFVAWPTYGFDMDLTSDTLKLAQEFLYFPQDLGSRRRVSEVLQLVGGREYWKIAGDGAYMDFDLSSRTTLSITTLDSFLGRNLI